MRAKWLLLAKVQLLGMTGLNNARKSNDTRTKRRTAGGLVMVLVIALICIVYSVLFAVLLGFSGMARQLPSFAIALSSLIMFLFSLVQGCSMLFALKDYDMVLSLPVSKRAVICSRLFCTYLANLLFCAAITLPILIVTFCFEGFSFFMLGIVLISLLFAPVLPISIAAALSTAITAATARFRHKNLLQGILGILLLTAILVLSFSFSFGMNQNPDENLTAMADILIGKIYPPVQLISWTLAGKIWGIFAFVGGSAVVGAAFIWIVSVFYTKINTALLSRAAGVAYKTTDIKSSSCFGALVRKEFKRLLSSSAYLMNGLSGTLFLIIAAIALFFLDLQTVLQIPADEYAEFRALLPPIGAGLLLLLIAMSCPSAAALSLEGKHREVTFSLPVSARDLLLAKSVPTFCFNGAAGVLFAISLCLRAQADLLAWVVILVSALLFSLFNALFGSFLNYKFPKYDWTHETQPVKQSAPVFITVFGGMILGFLAIFLSFFFGIWVVLAIDVLCLLFSILVYAYFRKCRLSV